MNLLPILPLPLHVGKQMELIAQLTLKRPFKVILEEYGAIDNYSKPILEHDLIRLYYRFVKKDTGEDNIENIKDVLRLPETRSFNLDKNLWTKDCFEDDPEILAKWRPSDEMFIVRISEYGRKNFRSNPNQLVADSSHKTNSAGWQGCHSIAF